MVISPNGYEQKARELSQHWLNARERRDVTITSTLEQSGKDAVDIVPVGSVTRLSWLLSDGYEVAGFNQPQVGLPPSELVMVK